MQGILKLRHYIFVNILFFFLEEEAEDLLLGKVYKNIL